MTNKIKIICYGDSNTYGYDPRGGRYDADHRWPDVAQKILGDAAEMVNAGFPGRTIRTVINPHYYGNDGDLFTANLTGVAPFDLLIVMLGSNDCIRMDTPEMIADNMDILLTKAEDTRYWRGKPQILLIAPPEILPGNENPTLYLSGYSDALNESSLDAYAKKSRALVSLYKALAEKHGTDFMEAAPYAKAGRVDHIHLTEDSQVSLGKVVADKLRGMLDN